MNPLRKSELECSRRINSALELLDEYPKRDYLNRALGLPKADQPLRNMLHLMDELGDRGHSSELLLSLDYILNNQRRVKKAERSELRQAIRTLWNGHRLLPSITSTRRSPLGIVNVPPAESPTLLNPKEMYNSMVLFRDEKAIAMNLSQEELDALDTVISLIVRYESELRSRPNYFADGAQRGGYGRESHISRDQRWAKEVLLGPRSFTGWVSRSHLLMLDEPDKELLRFLSTMNSRATKELTHPSTSEDGKLLGVAGVLHGCRSHLTPALIVTLLALVEEYNEDWAVSVF